MSDLWESSSWTQPPCTVCLLRGSSVAALFVARADSVVCRALEWFECGRHSPTDNDVGVERWTLTPIELWRAGRLYRWRRFVWSSLAWLWPRCCPELDRTRRRRCMDRVFTPPEAE